MASQKVVLVLSGGIALGAYQAGAYAVLNQHENLRPERLAGSSIGAVNAAVIAGNRPEHRIEQLRGFWDTVTVEPRFPVTAWMDPWAAGAARHVYSWLSVLQTRVLGRTGVFRPRLPELMLKEVTSLYDLAPLRTKLEHFIDFDRLNGGEVRVSVVTTDIETGQAVVFDTGQGDRIGPDHLLASCGFLPDFAPVEIDRRLLGDGGLVANAPVDTALVGEGNDRDVLCFVIDLFSPEGGCPANLEEAAARRWDLLFGNQSRQEVQSLEREYRLRWALGHLAAQLGPKLRNTPEIASALAERVQRTVTLFHMSYRPARHEAGPEKPFDFSRASFADRWEAGSVDMEEAIRLARSTPPPSTGVGIHRIQRYRSATRSK